MRSRVAAAVVVIACLVTGTSAPPLEAATQTAYDFNGHLGKFTVQVRQSAKKKFYVSSFTLLCGQHAYVLGTAKTPVSGSGAFSYSGAGTLVSQTNNKKSKTTLKASGKISISKRTGTAQASSTAKGCTSFSGSLKGYLLPVTS